MEDHIAYTLCAGYDAAEHMPSTTLSDEQHDAADLFTFQDPLQDILYYGSLAPNLAPNFWQASLEHNSNHDPHTQYTLDGPADVFTFPADDPNLSQPFVQGPGPDTSLQWIDPWSPGYAADVPGVQDAQFTDDGAFDTHPINSTWADSTWPDEEFKYYATTNVPELGGQWAHAGGLHAERNIEPERYSQLDASYETFSPGARHSEEFTVPGCAPPSSPSLLFASYTRSPSAPLPVQHVPVVPQHRSSYSELSANVAFLSTRSPSAPLPVQHVPVVPQHRSSYSELSANVAFLSTITQEAEATATRPVNEPSSSTPHTRVEAYSSRGAQRFSGDNTQFEIPSIRQSLRPDSLVTAKLTPPPPLPDVELYESVRSTGPASRPSSSVSLVPSYGPSTYTSRFRAVPAGNVGANQARRPLACFFCRERKIACGRPAEGSADPTCNQCKRRATPCDYPRESLRGQHRRSMGKNGGNGRDGDMRVNPGDYY